MKPDLSIAQQAAEWFALLRADVVDEADRQAWARWLEDSPEHGRAWQRVEAISRQFEALPDGVARKMLAARSAIDHDRRRSLQLLAVMATTGTLAWSGERWLPWRAWSADQQTAVGETRDLLLADGSRLWLNTDSAASVDFDIRLRRISLHRGELLIDSAADARTPPRPLVVDTVHGRLRALGTRFSVRLFEAESLVAVFDGAVEIQPGNGGPPQRVEAGQQARYSADAAQAVTAAEPARQAWSRGILIADNQRLDDFLAELSRYRRGYLACSPEVAHLRLVGAYPLADTDRVLAAVQATLPVVLHAPMPWWVTVQARPVVEEK